MRALLAITTSLVPGGEEPAAILEARQEPGTALVQEHLGRGDAVIFSFPAALPIEEARQEVELAAFAVGLPNRGIDANPPDGEIRVLELRTTMGGDAGFLRRVISGEMLEALAGRAGPGPLVLELPAGAELVRGDVEPIRGGPRPRFEVTGVGPVVYRVPVWWLLVSLSTLVAVPVVGFVGVRGYVRGVSGAPQSGRATIRHLRRARGLAFLIILVLVLPMVLSTPIGTAPEMIASEVAPAVTEWPWFRAVATFGLALLVVVGSLVAVALAARRPNFTYGR